MSPEKMARRALFTGEEVVLWSDGSLSHSFGFYVEGSPRPRTDKGRQVAVDAGWLVLGECSLYELDELPVLIEAALWAAKRDRLPGTVRERFATIQQRRGWMTPEWAVIQEDACGRAVVRCWTPHRLSPWAGFGVLDDTRAIGGRYTLSAIIRGSSTLAPGGLQFRRLSDLLDFMAAEENRPRREGGQK